MHIFDGRTGVPDDGHPSISSCTQTETEDMVFRSAFYALHLQRGMTQVAADRAWPERGGLTRLVSGALLGRVGWKKPDMWESTCKEG